jgi:hypothetical protein
MAQMGNSAVVIWPLDGAKDLATHMGNEIPNPVPTKDVLELGVPASLSVETGATIATASFSMFEEANGIAVPAVLLDKASDPEHRLPGSFVGLVPIEGLKVNSVYRVEFTGSITLPGSSTPQNYSRAWRFTTGGWAYPPHE